VFAFATGTTMTTTMLRSPVVLVGRKMTMMTTMMPLSRGVVVVTMTTMTRTTTTTTRPSHAVRVGPRTTMTTMTRRAVV
jgi:hypothetical protein